MTHLGKLLQKCGGVARGQKGQTASTLGDSQEEAAKMAMIMAKMAVIKGHRACHGFWGSKIAVCPV